jgi:hypothetical protein
VFKYLHFFYINIFPNSENEKSDFIFLNTIIYKFYWKLFWTPYDCVASLLGSGGMFGFHVHEVQLFLKQLRLDSLSQVWEWILHVRFEMFSVVVMKHSILCDIKPCSPVKVNWQNWRNILPPSLLLKSKPSKRPAWSRQSCSAYCLLHAHADAKWL